MTSPLRPTAIRLAETLGGALAAGCATISATLVG